MNGWPYGGFPFPFPMQQPMRPGMGQGGAPLGTMQPQPTPWANFPFPQGDPRVPPAGWEQQPNRPLEQYRKDQETIRWGDSAQVKLDRIPAGPVHSSTGYILECRIWQPAVCVLRLAATSAQLPALDATWTVVWQIQIGVGSSTQIKLKQVQIAPAADGTVDTDILLTVPLQRVGIQATVNIGAGVAESIVVDCTAHVAPVTSYEGMAR